MPHENTENQNRTLFGVLGLVVLALILAWVLTQCTADSDEPGDNTTTSVVSEETSTTVDGGDTTTSEVEDTTTTSEVGDTTTSEVDDSTTTTEPVQDTTPTTESTTSTTEPTTETTLPDVASSRSSNPNVVIDSDGLTWLEDTRDGDSCSYEANFELNFDSQAELLMPTFVRGSGIEGVVQDFIEGDSHKLDGTPATIRVRLYNSYEIWLANENETKELVFTVLDSNGDLIDTFSDLGLNQERCKDKYSS